MYYFAFSPAVAMEIGPADYRVNLILKLRRVWMDPATQRIPLTMVYDGRDCQHRLYRIV